LLGTPARTHQEIKQFTQSLASRSTDPIIWSGGQKKKRCQAKLFDNELSDSFRRHVSSQDNQYQ
jgi:hypothetical protein